MEGVELKFGQMKHPISDPIMKEEDDEKIIRRNKKMKIKNTRVNFLFFRRVPVIHLSCLLPVSTPPGGRHLSVPSHPLSISTSSTLFPFSPPAIQPHSFRSGSALHLHSTLFDPSGTFVT
jgi:hypothetical protein